MKPRGQRRAGVRLLPAVIVSLAALGVIKAAGLILGTGNMLSPITPATAQDAGGGSQAGPVAGNTPPQAEAEPAAAAETGGDAAAAPPPATLSESERAVLESLRARREALEQRDRSLVIRENLLRAAEQRLDSKVEELRALEERIRATIKEKQQADDEQFAGLVSMYESMKAKAAAQIFDRLPIDILVGVARRMKPQAMGEVLARMDPAAAERLTAALVQVSEGDPRLTAELDAIEPQ